MPYSGSESVTPSSWETQYSRVQYFCIIRPIVNHFYWRIRELAGSHKFLNLKKSSRITF